MFLLVCSFVVFFCCVCFFFFFFQAEEGIRIGAGVQTWALPLYFKGVLVREASRRLHTGNQSSPTSQGVRREEGRGRVKFSYRRATHERKKR